MIKECDCKSCGNYAPTMKNNCRALKFIDNEPDQCQARMTIEKAKAVDRMAFIDYCSTQRCIIPPKTFLKQFACIVMNRDELDAVYKEIVLRKEIELGLAPESALKNGR